MAVGNGQGMLTVIIIIIIIIITIMNGVQFGH
jgi:hypothetical protein